MKKLLSMIIVVALVLSTTTIAFAEPLANEGNSSQAIKGISTIYINDNPIKFETYTVGGLEYYKLRDFAKALNGTENQFAIEYVRDKYLPERYNVKIITKKPYKEVGGERSGPLSLDNIFVFLIKSYFCINFNNCLKLKDYAVKGLTFTASSINAT